MLHRFLHKTLIIINILAALALLVCYLSTHISPERFWLPALIALGYPILSLINLLFVLYWALRLKWCFIISLCAILLGYNHLRSFARLTLSTKLVDEVADISLITYNCNLFGLYSNKTKPVANEMMDYVLQGHHNIVCFQEFYTNEQFGGEQAKRKLHMDAHICYSKSDGKSGYGLATFSRFPIVGGGELRFADTHNGCIYTDLAVNGDTLRVYNVHLQSIRLKEHHLKFIHSGGAGASRDKTYAETTDIADRLHGAFKKRAAQADSIAAHVRSCRHMVIICGDFNDPPVSYAYRQLAHGRNDAFVEAGRGIMPTYKRLWRILRIDHVLHSKHLRTLRCRSPRVDYSDHYPVEVDFALR